MKVQLMEQIDLMDWLDETAVIKAAPPSDIVQQREWLKAQLLPLMKELDFFDVAPMAVSEALHFYANSYAEKAQSHILKHKSD